MRGKEQGFLAWSEVREVRGVAPAESGRPPRSFLGRKISGFCIKRGPDAYMASQTNSRQIPSAEFFFFFNLKYLVIVLCYIMVLVAACGIFTAVCRLFIVDRRLLSSCGPRVPEHVGSVVAPQYVGS